MPAAWYIVWFQPQTFILNGGVCLATPLEPAADAGFRVPEACSETVNPMSDNTHRESKILNYAENGTTNGRKGPGAIQSPYLFPGVDSRFGWGLGSEPWAPTTYPQKMKEMIHVNITTFVDRRATWRIPDGDSQILSFQRKQPAQAIFPLLQHGLSGCLLLMWY